MLFRSNYYDENNKLNKVVDSGIYKDSWFRYPNQSKEGIKNTEHIIEKGKIQDFIVDYIPKNSICIDDYKYIEQNKNINKDKPAKNKKKDNNKIDNKITDVNIDNFTKQFYNNNKDEILIKLFDECLKQERYDNYNDWVIIGMGLKNTLGENGFDLFNYISAKSTKYEGIDKTRDFFNGFQYKLNDGYTISTIYKFASEDNKDKFIEIIKKDSLFKDFDLTSTGIAEPPIPVNTANAAYTFAPASTKAWLV